MFCTNIFLLTSLSLSITHTPFVLIAVHVSMLCERFKKPSFPWGLLIKLSKKAALKHNRSPQHDYMFDIIVFKVTPTVHMASLQLSLVEEDYSSLPNTVSRMVGHTSRSTQ